MAHAVVFFDLDGTLMRDDKTVGSQTLQALRDLVKNGNLPVIATGRDLWEIRGLLTQTGIDTAVAGNGASIFLHGKLIANQHIAPALVTALSEQAAKDGLVVAWYNESGAVLSGVNELVRGNYSDVQQELPPVDAEYYRHAQATRMLIFAADDAGGQAVRDRYAQQFPELQFYRDSPFDLDLIERRLSKASGLKILLAQPELTGWTTYAFGDGDNDLPMATVVQHVVAMANASAQYKAAAEFVTASNMAGGIEKGLRHYGLI
ncbi:Cof-type HAD-IIB family hydrolase [Lacticaseibacillus zhaodongensis]|uniref:Cof-type HAD-IIB family hydrolase n=1 Tax=Lacticaseibacillus zhaodongensis TaxID=2668065 RepID=UPI0018AFF708|nr:Cof-type HAD-IIB family hydrolase [Lacticaseibacillus zhaodongensis]